MRDMESHLDLAAVLTAVGDAVVACDRDGKITLWNPAAERIFGFTRAEAMGASLDIIIPERQRERHWEGYAKTMETGVTKYGHDVLRVPAIDKAGRALSVSFTVAMLFNADASVSNIVSVMRDETDRFHKDRALRKRLAELEAQRAGGAAVVGSEPAVKLFDQPEASSGCPVMKD
jgi:PAS domain S-box-containing protein